MTPSQRPRPKGDVVAVLASRRLVPPECLNKGLGHPEPRPLCPSTAICSPGAPRAPPGGPGSPQKRPPEQQLLVGAACPSITGNGLGPGRCLGPSPRPRHTRKAPSALGPPWPTPPLAPEVAGGPRSRRGRRKKQSLICCLAKPHYGSLINADGHAEVWTDWNDISKFFQYGWRCNTNEDAYSIRTLMGNWNQDRFDIKYIIQPKPLPSQDIYENLTGFQAINLSWSLLNLSARRSQIIRIAM
ncbi:uncharacterized protein CFAP68 [Sorex araneus]|uniref:uncharacterized protein CFAP68 n=1 Tax=Sorex araneus TaxID=42254 RepID=UPI0024334CEE|nr:uncharacterized protein CFAP68 [Sorex araneus]